MAKKKVKVKAKVLVSLNYRILSQLCLMSSSNQNEASEQEIVPLNHGSPSQILRPLFETQTEERAHHAFNFIIIEGGGGNI